MRSAGSQIAAAAALRPSQRPTGPSDRAPRRRLVRALVVASAVPLTLLSLGIGAINWWNGQRTAATLAEAVGISITEQVRLQLNQLLAAPRQINSLNASAIREGRLDPNNFSQLASTFISQMGVFPVGYINYGNQEGDYVGIERLDSGALRLNLTDRRRGPNRQFVYAIGPKGPASQPVKVYEQMEPATKEAWYAETAKAGQPTWSSIYQWDDKPEVLSVSYNEPIRYPDGRLRGVIGVDFILSQLNSTLAGIWGKRPGLVVITERNGVLVASSSGNTVESGPNGQPSRRRINQSLNPLEREVGQLLFKGTPGQLRLNDELVQRSNSRLVNEQLGTTHSYVEVLPWSDSHGLDWVVMVIIPRQSLTGALQQQTLLTSLLCLLTLLVLLVSTTRLTELILRPLQQLSESARQLGLAVRRSPDKPLNFEPRLENNSAEEIATLSEAMANLIASFNGLLAAQRRSGNRLQREVEQKARALDQAIRKEREAHEAGEARERLLGHLGEEMLAPLAALRGSARLARGATDPQDVGPRLVAIESSAQQLEQLAHNLRNYAHLGGGHAELRLRPFEPHRLLEKAVERVQPEAERKGLAIDWQVASGTPERLLGDGDRLEQVLGHLLANAIRFTDQGAVKLEASVHQEGPEPDLVLQVTDTGVGMEPELVARVLSEDGTVPGPPQPGGAGLGLALCRRWLGLMRGKIQIASRSGEGTAITLTLPCESLEPTGTANPQLSGDQRQDP